MKKRGQLTIFIIIGIVILLLIAIIFFFQRQDSELRPKRPLEQKLGPVELYIQSCVDERAEEAILRMGRSGGYVYLPEEIQKYPAARVAEDPYGYLKVPMWYYDDTSFMPSLEEMEFQIMLYLNNTIKDCLDDFNPLKNEYKIKETGNPVFTVTIAESDVVIETEYPLEVFPKSRQEEYEVERFSTIIPVKLKKVYSLAKDIFETENEDFFLENMTLQLMTMNPSIPFTGIEFRCSDKEWKLSNIRDEIKDAISANFQRIRFKDTNYIPFLEDEKEYEKFKNLRIDPDTGEILNLPKRDPPVDLYEYHHFFFDVTEKDYSDLTVDTIYYREWPISIRAIPSEGGILKSETLTGIDILKFLCMEMWHFVYDVTFPVEFAIRDDASFGGKGYTFKFAIPVTIVHNRPIKMPLSARAFTNPLLTGELCTNIGGETRDIRAYDKITREELYGANISYQCLQNFCTLGTTTADFGVHRLRTQLPVGCANPKIIAEKEEYIPGQVFAGSTGTIEVPLIPLKEYDFNVTKILSINLEEEALLSDEVVLITIKNEQHDYEQNVVYPDVTNGTMSKLNLIYDSLTYELTMFVSKGDNYVGGWSGNWTVSANQLHDTNFINFKVYEKIPYPSTDEEIVNMIEEVSRESENYPPEFGVKE